MTAREGRRRRHRRHKARTQSAVWRAWTWHRRGCEAFAVALFEQSSIDPTRPALARWGGETYTVQPGQKHVLYCSPEFGYRAVSETPVVVTVVLRVVRRMEMRKFYGGSVQRVRHLPLKLEAEGDAK